MAWDRRWRILSGAAVWMAAAYGAWTLRGTQPALPTAVAIAQSREHRVAPVRLGRLSALEVAEGQRVAPGQIIARFETDTIQREMSVAAARLQQAASAVNATGGAFDASVLQVGRSFRAEVETARVEMESARSSFANDRAELGKLIGGIERERDLVNRGLARAGQLLAMDQRRAVLEESVKTWPGRIEALEARASEAARRLAEWEASHAAGSTASRSNQLLPFEAKVKEHHESMRILRANVDESVLRASVHAHVSAIHARPGDVVKPGDPVVTLVEAQPRHALAYIDERRGKILPQGTRVVAARRDGSQQRWEGVVSGVAADVSELPKRLWLSPAFPSWGRAMYITLPADIALSPGEMLDVTPLPENRPTLARTR